MEESVKTLAPAKRYRIELPEPSLVMTFILLEEKYPYFRSLLCHMQLEDLILETDASYLRTPAEKCH
jgi:hypothetical protein